MIPKDEKSWLLIANLWYIGLATLAVLGALVIYFNEKAKRKLAAKKQKRR